MIDLTTQQLQRAHNLIKAKEKQQAAAILNGILECEPDNAKAWWFLAHAAPTPDVARRALVNVLRLYPDHEKAHAKLARLNQHFPPSAIPAPTRQHVALSNASAAATNPVLKVEMDQDDTVTDAHAASPLPDLTEPVQNQEPVMSVEEATKLATPPKHDEQPASVRYYYERLRQISLATPPRHDEQPNGSAAAMQPVLNVGTGANTALGDANNADQPPHESPDLPEPISDQGPVKNKLWSTSEPPAPVTPAMSSNQDELPSFGASVGRALIGLLLAIPSGAYIGATVLVGEFIVYLTLGAISLALNSFSVNGDLLATLVVIVIIVAIIAVIFSFLMIIIIPLGAVIAIGGAIGGGLFGIVVGLGNTVCVAVLSLVYKPIVEPLSMFVGGVLGVVAYHHIGYDIVLDATTTDLGLSFFAGLNYIVAFFAGVFISALAVGKIEAPDEVPDEQASEEEEDDLGFLMAPWRMYGRVAGSVARAGDVVNPVFETPDSDKSSGEPIWYEKEELKRKSFKEEQHRKQVEKELRREREDGPQYSNDLAKFLDGNWS